jgi:SNF2 family DNA or RNA helicase
MNLEFQFVKNVKRDSVLYRCERADVTRNSDFWRVWRSPASDAVRKLIYLEPAKAPSGKLIWYAYRLKPLSSETPFGEFNLSYTLKDSSKLLPYQPKAVSHLVQSLINNGAAADGSDTGLGKTYQALAVCRELALSPLVVCRKAGVTGWARACVFMGVVPYAIVNWEFARTAKCEGGDKKLFLSRKKREFRSGYDYTWKIPRGILLIFDEAHLGFNEDSQNHALWTASSGRASLSLSATFADRPSRLKGLFQVVRIMEPERFDKWLLDRDHFFNQYNELESLTAIDDMKAINKIIYPKYGYRLSYEDPEVKKYFPERVLQTEIVDLGHKIVTDQNKAYKEMLEKAAKLKELGKQAELLVADLRYRQYAELLKVSILAEMAREYLYEGKAVIVFVNFRETLRYLAEELKTKSLIFGDQERFHLPRDAVIDNFQAGKERLILCMAEAGGQSISLHDVHGLAQRVCLVCPTYNPITLQQIIGRPYRAGSKSSPIIKLVYAAGTVEEKVSETVNRKLDNIAALNDGDLMEPDLFQLGIK